MVHGPRAAPCTNDGERASRWTADEEMLQNRDLYTKREECRGPRESRAATRPPRAHQALHGFSLYLAFRERDSGATPAPRPLSGAATMNIMNMITE